MSPTRREMYRRGMLIGAVATAFAMLAVHILYKMTVS